jgi:hypothetical protein
VDRIEVAIVLLVLAAAALVLAAPVLGRNGFRGAADIAMALAALAGISAFAVVTVDTLRSSRRKVDE